MTDTGTLAPPETFFVVDDDVTIPPTEDELPYSDGEPMESQCHILQMHLLMDVLETAWADRPVFIGGNMFVYFDIAQSRGRYFRGPDFFVVLDVPRRDRKSWVVWQEGKGPDVVVELLSEGTRRFDKGDKMLVYQEQLRVPEYYWYDPYSAEFAGFALRDGRYTPLAPDAQGGLFSQRLGLTLVPWRGVYQNVENVWLRFAAPDGSLLPTPEEKAAQAEQVAEAATRQREEAERQREAAERRAAELEAQLARYRERFGDLGEPS